MVGANGFEPSTSWSRTRESKNLKPCRCRTYVRSLLQNPPSVVPLVPHGLTVASEDSLSDQPATRLSLCTHSHLVVPTNQHQAEDAVSGNFLGCGLCARHEFDHGFALTVPGGHEQNFVAEGVPKYVVDIGRPIDF